MNIKYRTINKNQRINLAYEISYEKNIENYSFSQYIETLKLNNFKDKFDIQFDEEDCAIASRDKIFSKEEIFLAHILFNNIYLESHFSYVVDESSHLLGKLLTLAEAKNIWNHFSTYEHREEFYALSKIYNIL